MSGAVGINTKMVDRLAFSVGCGIAGIAGAAFTTIGSTGPDSGSRYIVDAFLVVVFGAQQISSDPLYQPWALHRHSRSWSSSSKAPRARLPHSCLSSWC